MGSESVNPLIVIVGPTASGKTSIAVELAERYNGEIICADSRTVYKGLDIGTAKPTKEELQRVQHWGLDLVEPNQRFTASDFKHYADDKITDIRQRGKVPFLVGGTGLYIDAVIFNFRFGGEADTSRRSYLEQLSPEELIAYCKTNNIKLPENFNNKRHLIRAIERQGLDLSRNFSPVTPSIIVGIATEKAVLRSRIETRSEQIFSQPVVNEASILGIKYGWDSEAMTGNIYPLIRAHLERDKSLEDLRREFISLDWGLAKRQLTWFRRNPHIVWLQKQEIKHYFKELLAAK